MAELFTRTPILQGNSEAEQIDKILILCGSIDIQVKFVIMLCHQRVSYRENIQLYSTAFHVLPLRLTKVMQPDIKLFSVWNFVHRICK